MQRGDHMDTYHLMIYGGGNSEIAATLEEEMEHLYMLQNNYLKIYAKNYLLVNSCYAMYKRFSAIKEQGRNVKSGGVYEYTYLGLEDSIKRQELSMGECSNPVEFEKFLLEGIKRLEAKEIILILIGQSYGNGIFIDFFNHQPTQLTYEDLFSILKRVGQEKEVYFHMILDITSWHGITLPYELSQIPCIASVFIWERSHTLQVFPITTWIQKAIYKGEHWMKVLYKTFHGYHIHTHPVWWKVCKLKWEEYIENPCAVTWKSFYEQYKYIVSYHGENANGLTSPLQLTYDTDIMQDGVLHTMQLIQYFKGCYGEIISSQEVNQWLDEMKKCITYYKL